MKLFNEYRPLNRPMVALSAAVLLAVCGQAWARQDAPKPSDKSSEDAVLRGPEVKDNSVPGTRGKFGGTGSAKENRGQQPIPPRVMLQAVNVLKSDSTPEADRLTAEQEKQVRAVQEEFRASQKAYFDEHRDEIMKLRSELGPENRRKLDERLRSLPGFNREGGRPGDKPQGRPDRKPGKNADKQTPDGDQMQDGMQAASEADQIAAMSRLKELAEQAPDAKDAQTRAWAVLSASQKALVEKELQRIRKEASQRKPGEQPAAGGPPALPPGAIGPDGKLDMSKLPPNMRQRLENLPPDEREKAIKRLMERSAGQNKDGKGKGNGKGGKGDGKGRPENGDGAKPPPPMDDVNVPPPR